MRKEDIILVQKPEGRNHLVHLCVGERIILKWINIKEAWFESMHWIHAETNGAFLWTR
jgi:hypothetical protein